MTNIIKPNFCIILLLSAIVASCISPKSNNMTDNTEKRKQLALEYFEAFHNGELEKVYSYFDENGTVQYATATPVSAKEFFPHSKDLIKTLHFNTHGLYASDETDNVIIHFSFNPKSDEDQVTEAIDIITFDKRNKISKIMVIPNSAE